MLIDLLVSHPVDSLIAEYFIWLSDGRFRDGSKQVKASGMKGGTTVRSIFFAYPPFPLNVFCLTFGWCLVKELEFKY